jgi:hypothetical protein
MGKDLKMKRLLFPAIALILVVGFVLVLASPASSYDPNLKLTIEKTVDFDGDGIFHDSETNYPGNTATWRIVVTNESTCPPPTGCTITGIMVTDTNGMSFGPFTLEQNESTPFLEYTQVIDVCGPNQAMAEGVYEWILAVGPPPVTMEVPVGPEYDDAEVICLTEGNGDHPKDGVPVGIEIYSTNKAGLLAPWLILMILLIGGTGWLLLINRRV